MLSYLLLLICAKDCGVGGVPSEQAAASEVVIVSAHLSSEQLHGVTTADELSVENGVASKLEKKRKVKAVGDDMDLENETELKKEKKEEKSKPK